MAFLSEKDLDGVGAKAFTTFMTGGKSKGHAPPDIDPEELAMGIKVEMEHTDDEHVARKIALDHLTEFRWYYTALKAMEDVLKAMKAQDKTKAPLEEPPKRSLMEQIKAKLKPSDFA